MNAKGGDPVADVAPEQAFSEDTVSLRLTTTFTAVCACDEDVLKGGFSWNVHDLKVDRVPPGIRQWD